MPNRIIWLEDTLTPGLFELELRGKANLRNVLEEFAKKAVAYMKENASWEDRTGAARDGLDAEVYETPGSVGVILYHSVDYGIWLEVRWGGTYAIIFPTIEALSGELMQELHQVLDVQGSGLEFG